MIRRLARRWATALIQRENGRLRRDKAVWREKAISAERRENTYRELANAHRRQLDTANRENAALDERLARLQKANEHLDRELADRDTAIEGLGLANAEMKQRLEHKQILDEDHAYTRRMDGEADHL